MTEETEETHQRLDTLACYTTTLEKSTYKSKILNKTFRFIRHKVEEYVDTKTGEILSSSQYKKLGGSEYNYGWMMQERREILDSFRSEVREFACFVLKFRNQRRGLSPNIGKVVEYYSKFSGKRVDNIKKRLLPHLYGTVIGNDTLMMPPFQLAGKNVSASYHLQEDFIAENKFFWLMQRKSYTVQEVA